MCMCAQYVNIPVCYIYKPQIGQYSSYDIFYNLILFNQFVNWFIGCNGSVHWLLWLDSIHSSFLYYYNQQKRMRIKQNLPYYQFYQPQIVNNSHLVPESWKNQIIYIYRPLVIFPATQYMYIKVMSLIIASDILWIQK